MRSLGEAGLVEKEMTTILLDQQIDDKEFSAEVEACLPKTKPWTIPEVRIRYVHTYIHVYCTCAYYEVVHTGRSNACVSDWDFISCTCTAEGIDCVGVIM